MNRYSATLSVLAAGLSDLRVSGQYKTGDSEGFAQAVAALHGLAVQAHAGRIEPGSEVEGWIRSEGCPCQPVRGSGITLTR
ncbi:hypothetical protein OOZ63_20665 [Paucibacter sp. PLA-PC-4]|uniref:hypothetical protein n=1 Tax=Paucibacter sp. PLA-PC-4 TaxID=2993655 RepID=UPI00224B76E0|nr:hypothetical protein [Paucibacter sp. PLA-PC-4]MCX2864245.1 hypothetical protein [Paucibacter sp. PLA-PC-4]